MTPTDTLPPLLAEALDKPIVGPVAAIVCAAIFILAAAWLIDRCVTRRMQEHEDAALAEYDAWATHWTDKEDTR